VARKRKPIPQNTRYVLVVITSIVLSVGGILIAAHRRDPSRGGQGGAVAVAFSFFVLFIRRDYGTRVYTAITKDLPNLRAQIKNLRDGNDPAAANSDGVAEVKRQITAIVARLETEAKGQKRQNIALALATVIGTIAWGFGDLGAQCLVEPPPKGPSQAAMTDLCVVNGLPELLTANAQYPSVCLDSIIARALHDEPISILVEGRSDNRPLRPALKRSYGDNFTLAYQRGLSLKAYLTERYRSRLPQNTGREERVEMFSSRIVVTAGGPNHIGAKPTASELSEDRTVEVFVYWNIKPNL
jgi:hypothetical protein